MPARLRGLLRLRRGLLVLPALLAGVTTASATWHLPGAGAGVARASIDFHAPSVTAATVAPAGASAAGGAVRPGGQFVLYANVVDSGSGVAFAGADLSALQAGATSVSLSPCVSGCTVGATTYGWSTAPLTADAGLAQGTRSYGVWAQDNAGNLAPTATFSSVVDSTSPSVTAVAVAMASPATVGWVRGSGSYLVYAKASDGGAPASGIATVTADVSSLTAGRTALALPKCTSSCTVGGVTYGYKSASIGADAALADGTASFAVTATDVAANTGTMSGTATADSTAPVVSAAVVANSSPSDPGFVRPGAAYLVYASASDSGLSTVTADVSALTSGQTALSLTACTTSCTVGGVTYGYKSASKTAGAAIPTGPTTFTVTATDKAANATTSTGSVTVDSTGPTVSAVAIANTTTSTPGWVRASGAYIVYANTTDPAGISTVKANVSALTSGQTALSLTACTTSCTVGGVTYGWKSASKTAASTLAAGAVSYSVTATDLVSNATTSSSAVTADNTAPTAADEALATVTTGVPGYLSQGRTYVVYTNASDAASGIYSVTANVKNYTTGQTALAMPACVSGCTVGGVTHAYASAALAANASITAGTKTWTVKVTDQAGNTLTSPTQNVVIDNTAPTVAITFPTSSYNGGWLAGCSTASTADVCGTASDATAGVVGVSLSFRQAVAPNLYWDPGTGAFSSAAEVLMPATLALPNWSLPAAAGWFTNLTSYTVRAVATDSAANTASASTTFTFKP